MSTVDLSWFKSSYSSGGDGDCVEVATSQKTVHVRDSKDTDGGHMALSHSAWHDFVAFTAQL